MLQQHRPAYARPSISRILRLCRGCTYRFMPRFYPSPVRAHQKNWRSPRSLRKTLQKTPKSWNMKVGCLMLVFLLCWTCKSTLSSHLFIYNKTLLSSKGTIKTGSFPRSLLFEFRGWRMVILQLSGFYHGVDKSPLYRRTPKPQRTQYASMIRKSQESPLGPEALKSV